LLGVGRLRERRVLLPGVTTLTQLVGSVREAANQRLWDTLYGTLSTGQRAVVDFLLTVPPGTRLSELDRCRGINSPEPPFDRQVDCSAREPVLRILRGRHGTVCLH
jgi:hypothetical protein